jgi:glutamate N-acetyltransferase / amino-acid N-acetyltransferase
VFVLTYELQVVVSGAPSDAIARRIGKEVVNSPLFKCAVAGNDPNVGRLLAVVGRVMGVTDCNADMSKTRLALQQFIHTFHTSCCYQLQFITI